MVVAEVAEVCLPERLLLRRRRIRSLSGPVGLGLRIIVVRPVQGLTVLLSVLVPQAVVVVGQVPRLARFATVFQEVLAAAAPVLILCLARAARELRVRATMVVMVRLRRWPGRVVVAAALVRSGKMRLRRLMLETVVRE